mgnify:CR=1 FL=1
MAPTDEGDHRSKATNKNRYTTRPNLFPVTPRQALVSGVVETWALVPIPSSELGYEQNLAVQQRTRMAECLAECLPNLLKSISRLFGFFASRNRHGIHDDSGVEHALVT